MLKALKNFLTKENLPLLGGWLYCFSIPLFQQFATLSIIAWALFSLIGPKDYNKHRKWMLLPLGFFVLYVLSFVLAPTDEYGILQRKLSLAIFPLIFYFRSYNQNERSVLLKAYLSGLFLSGFICLGVAIVRSVSFVEGELLFQPQVLNGKGFFESILYGGNYFFGRYFSFFHQTVYYALYLCFGILILLFKKDILQFQGHRWSLIGFFVFLIFLISNKGSFVALAGVFSLYILLNTKSLIRKIVLIFLLIISSIAWVKGNPRLNESFNKVISGDFRLDKNARYGYETRLLSWHASLSLIGQKPISGYGVAHAQEMLDKEYGRKEYRFPLKNHFNSHNQFFQYWIESGIIGLVLWIMAFVILVIHSRKLSETNRFFAYSFVLILFINSLFESVMNRFSGISFISFAICFLLTNIKVKQSH
jgi:O-antigen ligase